MANKIFGYKKIFGFVLPDFVDEALVRQLVGMLLTSAVMLFVLIFLVWPRFDDIDKLKATMKVKEAQLDSLKASKSGFDSLDENIPDTDLEKVLVSIPTSYSPESAIYSLRQIANSVDGVSLVSYSLPSGVLFEEDSSKTSGQGKKNEKMIDFVSYPIKIAVNAPVKSLIEYIRRIESSIPYAIVADIGSQEVGKLAKVGGSDKNAKVELEVRYYQAILRKIDISKVEKLTSDELSLAKKIATYQLPQSLLIQESVSVATSSSGLFGF